jgi:hypothetical protein
MNYEQLVTAIDVANQALLGSGKGLQSGVGLTQLANRPHLIEFEQSGQDRETYGEQLLKFGG